MNKLNYLLIALFMVVSLSNSNAQTSKFPIFIYGSDTVFNDEFSRVFNKNRKENYTPNKGEIEDYLNLYTKFKLKVKDAYDRQMDTMPQFVQELVGYRRTLASPYLRDKEVTDQLVQEAYERSLTEVNASHILINCAVNASSMDTLKAFHKIMELRKRIQNGESFEAVAKQFSEDPSAVTNGGNLGYFSAFQMIYPFENAAYSTKVGEISMPIKTRFGYHILMVHDKRKAQGEMQASHIMFRFGNAGEADSVKPRIDAIYKNLANGGNWDELCREFSEDLATKNNGGIISNFSQTTANIPAEFRQEAYAISQDGDFSKPFKTAYGWHIVKRIGITPIASLKEQESTLKRKIERDSRSELSKEAVLLRIKEENNYQYVGGLNKLSKYFDQSLLAGNWKKPTLTDNILLFTIGNKKYFDHNFFDFVVVNMVQSDMSLEERIEDLFGQYTDFANLRYEEDILEEKYDDFLHIMTEYRDGILLFELTDQEVWTKAVKDTVGLENFYKENISNYTWSERIDATIFSIKDEKLVKKISKTAKNPKKDGKLLAEYNKSDALMVKIDHKTLEKSDAAWIANIPWKKGVYNIGRENDRYKVVRVNKTLASAPKELNEVLGVVTSDYQNSLEATWLEQLKQKYPITLFEENIARLYQ